MRLERVAAQWPNHWLPQYISTYCDAAEAKERTRTSKGTAINPQARPVYSNWSLVFQTGRAYVTACELGIFETNACVRSPPLIPNAQLSSNPLCDSFQFPNCSLR